MSVHLGIEIKSSSGGEGTFLYFEEYLLLEKFLFTTSTLESCLSEDYMAKWDVIFGPEEGTASLPSLIELLEEVERQLEGQSRTIKELAELKQLLEELREKAAEGSLEFDYYWS